MKNEIRWYRNKEVSSELIESVEKYFNVKFPKAYTEIVKEHDGGEPEMRNKDSEWVETLIKIHSLNGRETGFRFLSYCRSEFYDVPQIISASYAIKDALPNPKKIIAFADNGCGDDLLFDYRKSESEPAIVFRDHEQTYNPGDFTEEELIEKPLEELLELNIHHVCDSFDELLEILYPDDFSSLFGDR